MALAVKYFYMHEESHVRLELQEKGVTADVRRLWQYMYSLTIKGFQWEDGRRYMQITFYASPNSPPAMFFIEVLDASPEKIARMDPRRLANARTRFLLPPANIRLSMLYWLFNKHFKIAVIKVKDTELEDFYSFLDALKESNENQPIHIYELRLHIDNTTGMRVDEERERKRVLESMHVCSDWGALASDDDDESM